MTPTDFVAVMTDGRDLDGYIRHCLTEAGPAETAMDRDALYQLVLGQHGWDLMRKAVDITDLEWGATNVARREAQANILDRAAVIAVEMGV
jgi:hypothetical protein